MRGRLLVGLVLGIAAAASHGAPLLWEATSADAARTIYLFGSIHFGRQSMYPLDRSIIDALERSKALAVEIDPRTLKGIEAQSSYMRRAHQPTGQSLSDLLEPQLTTRLRATATSVGLSPDAMESYQPWFASILIATHWLRQLGLDDQHGVERHLLNRWGERPVHSLESVEEQIAALADAPMTEQISFLEATIADFETHATGTSRSGGSVTGSGSHSDDDSKIESYDRVLVAAWVSGDAGTLEKLLLGQLGKIPTLRKRLLEARNHKMLTRLVAISERHQPLFVVVGAGHFIGPQGIVELMRRRGFTVRCISAAVGCSQ